MIFGWIVSGLSFIKRKKTGRLNGRKPAKKSKRSLEMRSENDPEISPIPEPPTDLVFGDDENPLPDCRHRIPKASTITELHADANEHRESMDWNRKCGTQNAEQTTTSSTSLLPDEIGSSEISLENENKRLTEENDNLKSSLQLATDERDKERAEFEEILMDKQRTIDYKDKSLVQQDEPVGKLTEENNALKTILASSEEQLVFLKKKI
jgi:hypothetical protein